MLPGIRPRTPPPRRVWTRTRGAGARPRGRPQAKSCKKPDGGSGWRPRDPGPASSAEIPSKVPRVCLIRARGPIRVLERSGRGGGEEQRGEEGVPTPTIQGPQSAAQGLPWRTLPVAGRALEPLRFWRQILPGGRSIEGGSRDGRRGRASASRRRAATPGGARWEGRRLPRRRGLQWGRSLARRSFPRPSKNPQGGAELN